MIPLFSGFLFEIQRKKTSLVIDHESGKCDPSYFKNDINPFLTNFCSKLFQFES